MIRDFTLSSCLSRAISAAVLGISFLNIFHKVAKTVTAIPIQPAHASALDAKAPTAAAVDVILTFMLAHLSFHLDTKTVSALSNAFSATAISLKPVVMSITIPAFRPLNIPLVIVSCLLYVPSTFFMLLFI